MSFCLDLILVDALPTTVRDDKQHSLRREAKLFLPVSKSCGGPVVPQLFDRQQLSILESLDRFLSHAWHFGVLFGQPETHGELLAPEMFLHLVVASLWISDYRHLKSKICQIAFEDIRRPNIEITDMLHDCRQDLDTLRGAVSYTKTWMPTVVHQKLAELQSSIGANGYVGLPGEVLQVSSDEAESTEKFLMDTYQLLMSSISVLDSQTSIEQAR